jgi:3'-5' exoribonuclease
MFKTLSLRLVSGVRQMIKDYILGERITAFLLLKQLELKISDSGSRLALVLGDRTGDIEAVVWNEPEFVKSEIDGAEVVKVMGLVSSYRNKPQITIEKVRRAEVDEYNPDDLKRASKVPPDKLKEEFLIIVESITEPNLKTLLLNFSQDEDLFDKWLKKPAGKKFHHDYISGLADHSLSLAHAADLICRNYDFLDRDLLVTGALLHDVGKTAEFEGEIVYDYSEAGRLIGHLAIGDHIVADMVKEIEDFPERLELKLRHLILSHHGELIKGAVVHPKTREAYVLNLLDEIDSRLDAINKIGEKADDIWSDYIKPLEDFLFFG